LKDEAFKIELAARKKDFNKASATFQNLKEEYNNAVSALAEHLQKARAKV
jgi:hypothetical protein